MNHTFPPCNVQPCQDKAEQKYLAGEWSLHLLSMSQTNQNYQNLLKTGCGKQYVKIEIFLPGQKCKMGLRSEGAVYSLMVDRKYVLPYHRW